jgi:hypothetical protein
VKVADVRRLALAFPGAEETPHFRMASFRVGGKIYATLPPEGTRLHVFVDEVQRETMIALHPQTYEPLRWGAKVMGLRVALARAKPTDVKALLEGAWQRKAPRRLKASR